MRRQAFTLVEIMIVVLIIGVLLMIAVPSWMKIRQTSQHNSCQESLRVIRDAKQQWGLDHGKEQTEVATDTDLAPVYIKKFPECPQNGTITIGDLNTDPECSVHGVLQTAAP